MTEKTLVYCQNCHKKSKIKHGDIPICRVCLEKEWQWAEEEICWDVEFLIEELQERIPSLFNGPICPWDSVYTPGFRGNAHVKCDCTYETGCKLLKDKEKKSIDN